MSDRAGWLSISAFARKYGVHRHTVAKWLRERLLETYRAKSVIRIRDLKPDDHRPVDNCRN